MNSLSVEAQLSLQQDDELFGLSSESRGLVEEKASAAEQPCEKPALESRKLKRQSKIPGCLKLSLEYRAMIGSKRAHFIPARRQEVAKIRRLGACLRCRSKKIACSELTPCKPCEHQKLLCHRQEPDIRRIDPVLFSLRTVDIFAMDPPCSLDFYKQLIRSHNFFFVPNLDWNIRWIFEECIAWLCGIKGPSATYSCGWTLSIHTTQTLFSDVIPKSRGNKISELLERVTIFDYSDTNAPPEESCTAQIQGIEAFVGSQMIQALEGLLKPKALAKSSQDQLVGLSILLFGELISVGYSNTKTTAWNQKSDSQKSTRRFCEARTHLLRVLIHHLVEIAGRLHDSPRNLCENQLLEQFSGGLADRGAFDWAKPLENRGSKLITNDSAQVGEEEKQPISKPIPNGSERTVEAINAPLPSLFLPMEAQSVFTDHSSWDSTTDVFQTMQLLEGNTTQRSSEICCTSCNTVLHHDGFCQSCLDNYVDFDAFIDDSSAL